MDAPIGRRCKYCGEPYEYHPGEEEWQYLFCSEDCRNEVERPVAQDRPEPLEEDLDKPDTPEEDLADLDGVIKEEAGQDYEGDPVKPEADGAFGSNTDELPPEPEGQDETDQ